MRLFCHSNAFLDTCVVFEFLDKADIFGDLGDDKIQISVYTCLLPSSLFILTFYLQKTLFGEKFCFPL